MYIIFSDSERYVATIQWVLLVSSAATITKSSINFFLGDSFYASGGRYPGFLIEWTFYLIESSQIKIFESIFELNFLGKKIIE